MNEAYYQQLKLDLEKAVVHQCPQWMLDHKDDLVQAGMMRVMALREKDANADFNSTYMYRVAHSAMIDEIRRYNRRNETEIVDEEGNDMPLPDEDASPEGRLLAEEIGQHIGNCLVHMITPRRLAVTLKLQGESAPQAAEILGWSLRKVENLLYRGLHDLRQCLIKKGITP
jgi:RNA polymerase sigma-70 factor (ECF subfamily)